VAHHSDLTLLEPSVTRPARIALGTAAFALVATAAIGAGPATASSEKGEENRAVRLNAVLTELNGSGASGTATAVVRGETIQRIEVHAQGLTPDAPHAQHIHYGDQALNECPTLAQDANGDGRLNTVEGVPAYGPVVVSLTTSGDTSPDSVLAVTRFPVAQDGRIDYLRKQIAITAVPDTGYAGGGTSAEIARSIREGEGVVVIHGLDYDGDGAYSLSEEGPSELNGALPAEATDPAACGVLR
jgi:hypothetical protein